jgi:integrase
MAGSITGSIKPNHNTDGIVRSYTVYYRTTAGKSAEKTFSTRKHGNSAKAAKTAAEAFLVDVNKTKQTGGIVDNKAGKASYCEAVNKWIETTPTIKGRSRGTYRSAYTANIQPAYEGTSIDNAARDRAMAEQLLNQTMMSKGDGTRRLVRHILVSVLDELVINDTITRHKLANIKLAKPEVTEDDYEDTDKADGNEFKIVGYSETERLAKETGPSVWLMRYCGLRIHEALGVMRSDFYVKDGKTWLRLRWQSSMDGQSRVPLKHRPANTGRDIPVPDFVWEAIQDKFNDDGILSAGQKTRFLHYETARRRFNIALADLSISNFTFHKLRHGYATELLHRGVNIANLSKALGHKDVATTLRVYVHESEDWADQIFTAMAA